MGCLIGAVARWQALTQTREVLGLYREQYFDLNSDTFMRSYGSNTT